MVGWPREMREEEKRYVLPNVRDLPGVGLITGRGDTANVELLLRTKPDMIRRLRLNARHLRLAG